MILVVSHRADEHTRAVLAALRRRGAPSRLLDLSRVPTELSVTIGAGGEDDGPILAGRRGPPLRLDEVRAVWWRRPQPFVLHDDLRGEQRRISAWRETREAFAGLWQSLDARWVNHPVRDEAATHKPWQLVLAGRLGLRVPRTCITSDPARARAFVKGLRPGRTVFKSLQATRADWRTTRLVRAKELGRLDVVRYAADVQEIRWRTVASPNGSARPLPFSAARPQEFLKAVSTEWSLKEEWTYSPVRMPESRELKLPGLLQGLRFLR